MNKEDEGGDRKGTSVYTVSNHAKALRRTVQGPGQPAGDNHLRGGTVDRKNQPDAALRGVSIQAGRAGPVPGSVANGLWILLANHETLNVITCGGPWLRAGPGQAVRGADRA